MCPYITDIISWLEDNIHITVSKYTWKLNTHPFFRDSDAVFTDYYVLMIAGCSGVWHDIIVMYERGEEIIGQTRGSFSRRMWSHNRHDSVKA